MFKGPGAAQRRLMAAVALPALSTGLGSYTLDGDDKHPRISQAFEYAGDPRAWEDGRVLICHHQKGNSECGVSFSVLSNEH